MGKERQPMKSVSSSHIPAGGILGDKVAHDGDGDCINGTGFLFQRKLSGEDMEGTDTHGHQ